MHEMSIAASLLELAEAEALSHGCPYLDRVRVEYGPLSGVMPEALRMGFEILIRDTPHCNAVLELVPIPLRLRCPFCNATFGGQDQSAVHQPCPACGETFGHIVEQGRELLLTGVEASAHCRGEQNKPLDNIPL